MRLPKIYPSLQEYTPLFNTYMRPSENLPFPPRIYSHYQQLYAILPEYTLPSQNIPPFSTAICDPPRIYPSLPEYTPSLFSHYMRLSRIYPSLPEYTPLFNTYMRPSPFSTTIILCDPSRISPPPSPRIYSLWQLYATLTESSRNE